MSTSSGLRERIRHALVASVGIFTLALAFWAVNTGQQSEADVVTRPYGFTPNSGEAPLLVTASYTGTTPTPGTPTTVTFDDIDENVFVTDQYSAAHGLTVAGTNGGRPITAGSNLPGQRCNGGTEASSQPQYLSPRIGDLPGYGGVTLTFATPIYQPGVTLVSVGRSTVTLTYAKADGTVAETKTVGPKSDDPSGACQKDATRYQGSEAIAKITIQSNEPAGGEDGYGIDDLIFLKTAPTPTAGPAWDFGEGQGFQEGATLQHTYTQAGQYTVKFRLGSEITEVGRVTVTARPEPGQVGIQLVPASGPAPLTVKAKHTGPGSTAGTGTIDDSRTWNCGLPGGAVLADGAAEITCTYPNPGVYTITLGTPKGNAQATVTVTSPSAKTAVTSLVTSKATYQPGEAVAFTLVNQGPDAVTLGNGAPWVIEQDGKAIFQPLAIQALETLTKDKSKQWSWDQKDSTGQPVTNGTYVVAVSYGVDSTPFTKRVSFGIATTPPPPPPPLPASTFKIEPTSGNVPLLVSITCTGTLGGLTVDLGDGTVLTSVQCPATLKHTYTVPGSYTVIVRDASKVHGTQLITASGTGTSSTTKQPEPPKQDDGKGKPSQLAASGSSLLLTLLVAAIVAGVVSYLIIRRPFHDQS